MAFVTPQSKRHTKLRVVMLVVGTALSASAAQGRGSVTSVDEAWNPHHVQDLPADIRAAVIRFCGNAVHAQHYFVTYSDNSRLIRLHFEHAHCRSHEPLCNSSGCLHQEYILTGNRYRLLRSYYGPNND